MMVLSEFLASGIVINDNINQLMLCGKIQTSQDLDEFSQIKISNSNSINNISNSEIEIDF